MKKEHKNKVLTILELAIDAKERGHCVIVHWMPYVNMLDVEIHNFGLKIGDYENAYSINFTRDENIGHKLNKIISQIKDLP